MNPLVQQALDEAERLRSEGWTKQDFAKALKDMFAEIENCYFKVPFGGQPLISVATFIPPCGMS